MPETNTEVADRGGMLVRALHVRAVRPESREADFVCSTEALDAHGTVLKQDWKLDRYKKNPVVLWAHESRDLPIGQSTFIAVENGQLVNTIRFASEKANPKAEQVWQGVLEETIRAVSVGFEPSEMILAEVNGETVVVLTGNELFEISVTPIPSNPEALKRLRSRALESRKQESPMAAERGAEKEPDIMDEKQKAALEGQISERDTKIGGLSARVSELETKLSGAESRATELDTKLEGLSAQNKALVEERDALKVRAEDLNSKIVAHDVDKQVGVKISAAERDTFIKLRLRDPELYAELLAQRSDMDLTKQVIPSDVVPPAPVGERNAESEDLEAIQKRAATAITVA